MKFFLGLHRGNSRATLANFLDIMDNIPLETTTTCLLAEQAASVSGSSSADLIAATLPPINKSQDDIDGSHDSGFQGMRHAADGSAMTSPMEISGHRSLVPRLETLVGCFRIFKRHHKKKRCFMYFYDEEEF